MAALIAIVGRPNVGKSALFNRVVGKRIAIVHDEPGVTRDRITAEAEWQGRPFTLVDTGGIGLLRGERAQDVITKAAFDQVQLAIDSASAIILVVNVQEGVVALDREVAVRLRRSGKPVVVAVNKVDSSLADAGLAEFSELGFDQVFPVSAIHDEGIEPLMNAVLALVSVPEAALARRGNSEEGSPIPIAASSANILFENAVESGHTKFGVPPSGGSGVRPPEGGTPNRSFQTGS